MNFLAKTIIITKRSVVKMKRVAVLCSGIFPVPPVNGGAVSELIQLLVDSNEKNPNIMFDIFSVYDSKISCTTDYKFTDYCYTKIPKLIRLIDKINFEIIKLILGVDKSLRARYLAQRGYHIYKIAFALRKNSKKYDFVLLEGDVSLFKVLKLFRIEEEYKGKICYHIHNDLSGTYGCKKQIETVDKLIGVSKYVVERFQRQIDSNSKMEVSILKNVIDLSRFKNNAKFINVRKKYGFSFDDKIIIYVGRLTEQKGVYELIEAVKKIPDSRIKLLIVGSTLFKAQVTNQYAQRLIDSANDIKNRVVFAGYIPNELLYSYYRSADIAVFPSLRNEAAGLTNIEALACGIPIITTNVGGIPEYVNSDCATFVDINNIIEDIKNQIIGLLSDKKRRDKLVLNGINHIKQFDYLTYSDSLAQILK
jgi:spore coat protein SA